MPETFPAEDRRNDMDTQKDIQGMPVPDEGFELDFGEDFTEDTDREEEKERKPSAIRTAFNFIKDSISAIFQGEFLMRLKFDRYFIHIIYLFFLAVVCIWMKLRIEQTMVRLEDTKQMLEDYRIYHAQKTCELVKLDRLSTVQDMLEKSGSVLTIPDKPADRIKK